MEESTENIRGKLYIPDYVTYRDTQFEVTRISRNSISDYPELTSISTPVGCNVTNCPNLTEIEFRDKCLIALDIYSCPRLKSIVYPKNCNKIGRIFDCDSLTSLTVLCKQKVFIEHWGGPLWETESLPLLTDIYFPGDIPPVLIEDIDGSRYVSEEGPDVIPNEDIRIHIPEGTADVYRHKGWDGWNLVEDQKPLPAYVNWDYCGKDEWAKQGFARGDGKNDVEMAIRIPASHISPYKGSKITAIEFFQPNSLSPLGDGDYVFITTPGTDYLTKQAAKAVKGGWARIELNEPYIITGDELFVGVGAHHSLGLDYANFDIEDNGCWSRSMGDDDSHSTPGLWETHKDLIGGDNHPFPIRAIIEGEKLPTDIVIVKSELSKSHENSQTLSRGNKTSAGSALLTTSPNSSDYFAYEINNNGVSCAPVAEPTNQTSASRAVDNDRLILKIRNRSPHIVRDISFEINANGSSFITDPIHTAIPNGEDEIVSIDIPDNLSGRNLELEVNVNDIDGKPDEISANSTQEVIYSSPASTHFPRVVVMERKVSTWNGASVASIAVLDWMSKLYPENFIGLSIHYSDEMSATDNSFKPFLDEAIYTSHFKVNRGHIQESPNPINIDNIIDFGEASINADASFDGNNINISTETVFGFDDEGEDKYRIAYVLLEDNVGPYTQCNDCYSAAFPQYYPEDHLTWWRYQGEEVEYTYNNVARTIHDYDGIKGLFPDKIIEGQTYKNSYTMAIPSNVDDASNLRVVTLLLDAVTGEILNADQTSISGTPPVSALPAVITDGKDDIFDIYNLSGVKVRSGVSTTAGLPPGLYILRSPTSTRKIAIP